MELVFQKIGNKWVAEFEATSDFNIHIERKSGGNLIVAQSGVQGGEYDNAFVKDLDCIIDYDFGALVYPKYIKVSSGSEVVKGVVTFAE